MGSEPFFIKKALVFEKCRQPKKPLFAASGEGCAAVRMWCFFVLIRLIFSCAKRPQRRKTTLSFNSEIFSITVSVKWCQPILEWLIGSPALTVRDAFNNN